MASLEQIKVISYTMHEIDRNSTMSLVRMTSEALTSLRFLGALRFGKK